NRASDITITTFHDWNDFASRVYSTLVRPDRNSAAVYKKAVELNGPNNLGNQSFGLERAYEFVSEKIATVDLPLGATGLVSRPANEILDSGYATPMDKCVLLNALSGFAELSTNLALIQSPSAHDTAGMPRPSAFDHVIAVAFPGHFKGVWMDVSLGVAPFGLVQGQLRGRPALVLSSNSDTQAWQKVTDELPFPAFQDVAIQAKIGSDGTLESKVRYRMRGDNELLLRVAFHQSPREKWNEVAQLLSLSDGFRGKVEKVSASDPYATKDPFTLEYEITQP